MIPFLRAPEGMHKQSNSSHHTGVCLPLVGGAAELVCISSYTFEFSQIHAMVELGAINGYTYSDIHAQTVTIGMNAIVFCLQWIRQHTTRQ